MAILEPVRPPTLKAVGRVLSEERPSLLFSVPTHYAALLASDLPADAFSSVRLAVSAGEALPADVFHRFRDRFGVELLDGIGSTELTHIFISNRPGRAVAGASGYPVTGYTARLVDPDGHDVDVDTPGQLWVKGETAATGYWCRTGESRRTFVGDWTHTGDTYELFKVAGEWVSPYEVESVLVGHPSVVDAAVVGVSMPEGVLKAIAFVTLTAGTSIEESELIEFCRPHLVGFKRPKQIIVLDEMPKTATGKIRRVALRELATIEGPA
jgi:acyl-coenzyme A synthetase/AMP-(fatty) acid ligase